MYGDVLSEQFVDKHTHSVAIRESFVVHEGSGNTSAPKLVCVRLCIFMYVCVCILLVSVCVCV